MLKTLRQIQQVTDSNISDETKIQIIRILAFGVEPCQCQDKSYCKPVQRARSALNDLPEGVRRILNQPSIAD